MARPTDKMMTAIGKTDCYTTDPRMGSMPCHKGPHREDQGWSGGKGSGARREQMERWVKVFIMISTGRNERNRVSRFRIGSFEYFEWVTGHWDSPINSCLVPRPGVIRQVAKAS